MTLTATQQQQMAQAEALLGDPLAETGFARGLYFGKYLAERLPPYPHQLDRGVEVLVERLRIFCRERIDADTIDREAEIPRAVIDGLGELGILGACLPKEVGGLGLNQVSYCRLLEVLGGHCGSTALFVNAHHSIGPRALVLYGTPEQKNRWLPRLATGEWLSAFALTEPEAGSDAGNVQTTALPSADGKGFLLNGEKRWITNGGIAQALIVMARTPSPTSGEWQVTAFQVSPDMPGFEVVEERMEKLGVRGTATARLKFREMYVPQENILGEQGRGLKIALTVLDFGRTTFGATCTGAAKFCVRRSVDHVRSRVQFGQPLAEFELVRQKIAWMEATTYAVESMTFQTAALIDAGREDYMLETAMLKVFATESLWQILEYTFALHGGMAYFCDQPFERMIRDARINTIGEGSNDVLRLFIALVGMRDVGMQLREVVTALNRPMRNLPRIHRFAAQRLERFFSNPDVPSPLPEFAGQARRLGRLVGKFGSAVERLLGTYGEGIVQEQCAAAQIAEAAMDLFASGCVLARLRVTASADDSLAAASKPERTRARHFLDLSARRIQGKLQALKQTRDVSLHELADLLLAESNTEPA